MITTVGIREWYRPNYLRSCNALAQELGLEETGRQKFRKEIFVFLKRGSAERGGGLKTNCRGWHSVCLNGNEMLGRL